MSKIMILTDSCCDIPKETIEELGITVLPFEITLDGKTFRETFDVTKQEFYEMMMKTNEVPKHSQISPSRFEEAYKRLYDDGYTDII
ncbi:MAG: DegV family protein, partial [Ruminococcus sp.]|nr:DegV family protein [Ruminococcus sp.]